MSDAILGTAQYDAARQSLYRPIPCRVESVAALTPLERQFRLVRFDGLPFGHQPGQFMQVSVFGAGEAPISVASSPTRGDWLEMGIRRMGTVTRAIHRLTPGDQVGIRGPFGRGFVLEAMRGKDVVLIAGGCGLAPMRALVQYCEDRREEFGEVSLLAGAKTPADMLYKEDLLHWVRSQAIRCRSTVDAVPGGESWQGHVGLVTELIVPLRVDAGRTVAVIVGPPVMYRPVIAALRAKGLADGDIMVSLERHMKCGVGKCGHCAMDHLYCCLDGPVFWFPEIAGVKTAL